MKKKLWILGAVLLCLLLGWELYRSNRVLTVEYEQIPTELVTDKVRIVHLSDLHNAQFGENNEKLLAAVADQEPDLIFFTGDLITGSRKETDVAMDLVEQLVKIAPVYVSLGNHELRHEKNFSSDLSGMLEYRGATLLEYDYEDVTVNGQQLRIGGISACCVPEIYLWTGEAKPWECDYLKDFQNTPRCTLLLAHIPVAWIQNGGIDYWDVDLVFSGHTHGGQFRIPLIGGVFGPDVGLFPGWMEGRIASEDGSKSLILSRGLGNSLPIPRLNNPPQVLVVDVIPK